MIKLLKILNEIIIGHGLTVTKWKGWLCLDIYYESLLYKVDKIENTYAWIIDTEISKINNKICENNIIFIKSILEISWPEDPKRDSSKWPAIIFAVKRIERVIGRISNLIDSMITIKGINKAGVPWGVRWVRRLFK